MASGGRSQGCCQPSCTVQDVALPPATKNYLMLDVTRTKVVSARLQRFDIDVAGGILRSQPVVCGKPNFWSLGPKRGLGSQLLNMRNLKETLWLLFVSLQMVVYRDTGQRSFIDIEDQEVTPNGHKNDFLLSVPLVKCVLMISVVPYWEDKVSVVTERCGAMSGVISPVYRRPQRAYPTYAYK